MRFASAREQDLAERRAERAGAGNALDRAIQWAFPGWALRRTAARKALQIQGYGPGYDAGRETRLNRARRGTGASADAEISEGRLEVMRDRSRDLIRNDAIAASVARALTDNVVGKGIVPHSKVSAEALGISDEAAREFQTKADEIWARWAPQAMADGRDIYAGQSLVMRKLVEDGESFALPIMSRQRNRPYETAVQVIEPDRVDTPRPGGSGAAVNRDNLRFGIEFGREGQPMAYWVSDRHPGDILIRKPLTWRKIRAWSPDGAPNVYHVFRKLRNPQSRGVPLLAAAMADLRDLSDIMEAEREAQRVQACFAGFITTPAPMPAAMGASTKTNSAGQRVEELEPGILERLGPGEEITFGDPKRPGGGFAPFVEILERRVGSSVGLPYEFILLNFKGTSYSSYRGVGIEAWRGFECWQELLIHSWLWWVRFELLHEAWLKGELPMVPDLVERKELWCAADWHGPIRQSVDPSKDATNSKLELAMRVSSPKIECARRGRDWREIQDDWDEYDARTGGAAETEPEPPAPGEQPEPGEPPKDDNAEPQTVPAGPPRKEDDDDE